MIEVQCDAVLFDFDGVLVNSTPAVERVWSRWAARHGLNAHEVIARAHGRPSINTIAHFLPKADHEAENRIVESWEIADVDGVVPLPGAIELVNSLPDGRWTIVTSCTRDLAAARFRASGLKPPSKFVTATDVVRGKPDPEPYLKGASLLGFSPNRCVVFEDVAAGIKAGHAAGSRVAALTTTLPKAELLESRPEWILRNCDDVRVDRSKPQVTLRLAPA